MTFNEHIENVRIVFDASAELRDLLLPCTGRPQAVVSEKGTAAIC